MARLIWTEPALQDLEQIADYIALDNELAAKKLVQKVFYQAEMLQQFPEMCAFAHDLLGKDLYRHLIVGPLRIFYRVQNDDVYLAYVMRHERQLKLSDLSNRNEI